MNEVELLRYVADNLEAGREAGAGLLYNGSTSKSISVKDIRLDTHKLYAVAPRTHKVNNFTVPYHMHVEPEDDTIYYVPSLDADDLSYSKVWEGDPFDKRVFYRGLCFNTREAAQHNTLAITGRDPALGVEGV